MPSDEALRATGKDILQTAETAADDDVLLEKFKELLYEKMPFLEQQQKNKEVENMIVAESSVLPLVTENEGAGADLDVMLQDLDFDLDPDFMNSAVIGGDEDGGAPLF
ncbi:hypothetical protein NQ176_g10069 [Zarea fungicola]|uniref:Uncharacterized protein n=1 Tax=Zarea fungicola TaxID=93591 RepID=A0ACC1MJ83_9HYPO|nr:hypothetical protein NQ176_g10069 [Lecanicillium fungicola]